MKIGFIGLGQMGQGMALNLAKSGEDLIVCDLFEEKLLPFKEANIKATTEILDLKNVDVLFTCLPNGKVVRQILLDNNILDQFTNCDLIVDCSTVDYHQEIAIGTEIESLGFSFMDAPVSGMQAKAEDGTLSIMCGGSKESFELVKGYLEYMGSNVVHLGPIGSGQLMKTINNTVYNMNCIAFQEMLAFAQKMGIPQERFAQSINAGTARSYASEYFMPKILERDFVYGFSIETAYKDMVTAINLGMEKRIPIPMLNAADTIYKLALLQGYGENYKGTFIKVYENFLGLDNEN